MWVSTPKYLVAGTQTSGMLTGMQRGAVARQYPELGHHDRKVLETR